MSAPQVFNALRPERKLSAPPEPLVPLQTLMVTMPPPGDTGSQESAALLPILLAARATANTEGHHAAIFRTRITLFANLIKFVRT